MTSQELLEAHTVLVEARNIVARDGWTTGCPGMRETGPVCVDGAIARAAGMVLTRPLASNCYWEVEATPAGVVFREANEIPGLLFSWNDKKGRKEREVLAAFDRAICASAPPPADPYPVERLETSRAVMV